MKIDDVRKTVSNPKPLYFAAGLGDAAVEVLKDAPTHLNTLSSKAGVVATDVAGKVAGTAESLQSRIALGQLDPKALRGQLDPKALRAKISELSEPDLRAAREKAQTLLLQQVGWALEVAGKAVETYDEYSERGKVVVERVRGSRGTGAETVEDGSHTGAERIVVEHVTVVDAEEAPAKPEAPKADAPQDEAPKSEAPKDEAPKSEAPKDDAPKTEAKAQDKPADDAKSGAKKQPTPPRRQAPRNGK
jgi:heparin binding hemagglutinin HbhA